MSRAFVKEDVDVDDGLPERLVSPHPNFVTPEGLLAIEAEVTRLGALLATAKAAEDAMAVATLGRDLRYWQQRRSNAEPISPPDTMQIVQFGSTVTVVRDDGRRQSYRIVGEDEADPKTGTVSHVSPLAQAALGRSVGDEIVIAGQDAEIVSIS
ncbi:transcription elongation factor GreA [Kaistia terrae]|uniref:Transcription elongation factor GreA n=1 Tax=Kaistia terrae TaxID=537017 RepID=A0ABW0Q3J2_9HYPH|nr:transcription elongation factor GreA [Kaistia terrae]MCX5581567.1 transcription elongation factor GreA [Kaistia terrae]